MSNMWVSFCRNIYDYLKVPINEEWVLFDRDNIDFSYVADVDADSTPRIENYQTSFVDIVYRCFCYELAQHPHGTDWYWISPIQRCFGFMDEWENRIDGKITLQLKADRYTDSYISLKAWSFIKRSEIKRPNFTVSNGRAWRQMRERNSRYNPQSDWRIAKFDPHRQRDENLSLRKM